MNTTDKEREEVLEPRYTDDDWKDAEDVFDSWFGGYECFAAARIARIRAEAKAEALAEAAEMAYNERLRKGYEKSDFNAGYQHGIDTAIDAIIADEPRKEE